jgi:hypothetical protein
MTCAKCKKEQKEESLWPVPMCNKCVKKIEKKAQKRKEERRVKCSEPS